jgi:hypothetical protein
MDAMKSSTATAMDFTEAAEAVAEAVDPRYEEQRLREILESLKVFSMLDPRRAFGRTVRDHRDTVTKLDVTLTNLCHISRYISEAAARIDDGFAAELERTVLGTQDKWCVVRALSATLMGDRAALEQESPTVADQVRKLLEDRAKLNASSLPEEERALLQVTHENSEELEAWLAAP